MRTDVEAHLRVVCLCVGMYVCAWCVMYVCMSVLWPDTLTCPTAVNPPTEYGSLVVLEEINGTMYWVSQYSLSEEPPLWSIRICLSTDGINWLDAFNNT